VSGLLAAVANDRGSFAGSQRRPILLTLVAFPISGPLNKSSIRTVSPVLSSLLEVPGLVIPEVPSLVSSEASDLVSTKVPGLVAS